MEMFKEIQVKLFQETSVNSFHSRVFVSAT